MLVIIEGVMVGRISDAEHAVMEILWAEHPLTAQAVIERIPSDRSWGVTTVKTLLARLVGKGALAATSVGRRHEYRPLIERSDYVSTEFRHFIDRLFRGKLAPFVALLAEQDQLSSDDIANIEVVLKALKK